MSRFSRLLFGALIACAITPGPVRAAGFTAVLSIPNLCSTSVTVAAFAFETSNTESIGSGGGGGAGKATIKPLVLTKPVDECTPLEFKAVFTGQHFQTATLQVSSGKNAILFTLQLRDVLVTDIKHGFSIGGQGPSDDVLMETITLDAATFSLTTGDTTVTCSQATNSCQ